MRTISEAEVSSSHGLATSQEVMQNGERRFRLTDRDGLGYIRTEASPQGAWQNSHLHNHISETYVVQTGWIACASLGVDAKLALHILREGGVWTSPVGEVHNVYMSGASVTHVVKHGRGTAQDWHTNSLSEMLDAMTKNLSEQEILKIAGDNSPTDSSPIVP